MTELFMCTSELCFDNALRHRKIDKQPVCMDRGTLLAQFAYLNNLYQLCFIVYLSSGQGNFMVHTCLRKHIKKDTYVR